MPRAKRRCAKVGCRKYHPCPVHPWGWQNSKSPPLPADWKRRVRDVLARDKVCQHCGLIGKGLECDHIVPRSRGGSDELWNLQALCVDCHKVKTDSEKRRRRR